MYTCAQILQIHSSLWHDPTILLCPIMKPSREGSWVCSGGGISDGPTDIKSQNHGSGFYNCLTLHLGNIFSLSFSQDTHPTAWKWRTQMHFGLTGNLISNCLQSSWEEMNKSRRHSEMLQGFRFALSPAGACWGQAAAGEWAPLGWGVRPPWGNTTEATP